MYAQRNSHDRENDEKYDSRSPKRKVNSLWCDVTCERGGIHHLPWAFMSFAQCHVPTTDQELTFQRMEFPPKPSTTPNAVLGKRRMNGVDRSTSLAAAAASSLGSPASIAICVDWDIVSVSFRSCLTDLLVKMWNRSTRRSTTSRRPHSTVRVYMYAYQGKIFKVVSIFTV